MSPSNCWNLRVTAEVNQGGRKYMEDVTSVQFERVKCGKIVVEYAAFAIFDGHGGKDAAQFASDNLLENIKQQKGFFSSNEDTVKKSISDAFVETHLAMWHKLPEWPKTPLGHPSTAGTTASLAIIRGNRMYVANVGDSMIVMGSREISEKPKSYIASGLTIDHKPELQKEKSRIEKCGGSVINKSGVNRVVWSRPKLNHNGPIRRSTQIDKIPFLAVARSLGDLWSFNSELNEFVVSPVPDVYAYDLHHNKEQFLVLASDGLWNMVRPQECVAIVASMEENRKKTGCKESPAHSLVQLALDRWAMRLMRADNTSVIVVIIERRKIEPSHKKDSYFESWTSAKNEETPVESEPEPLSSVLPVKNQPSPPSTEVATPCEPLQDSSISSSNGDVIDDVSGDPSKTSETEPAPEEPSSSGIGEAPTQRQTRSKTIKDEKEKRRSLRKRKSLDQEEDSKIKTRRVSLRGASGGGDGKNQQQQKKKSVKPRRAKSEGGAMMRTPLRSRRLRSAKKRSL